MYITSIEYQGDNSCCRITYNDEYSIFRIQSPLSAKGREVRILSFMSQSAVASYILDIGLPKVHLDPRGVTYKPRLNRDESFCMLVNDHISSETGLLPKRTGNMK
jgi:hypothetical protein